MCSGSLRGKCPRFGHFISQGDHLGRYEILGAIGDGERAMHLLRTAFNGGFQYGIDVHRDWDLEPLWDDPEFQEIVRPKG